MPLLMMEVIAERSNALPPAVAGAPLASGVATGSTPVEGGLLAAGFASAIAGAVPSGFASGCGAPGSDALAPKPKSNPDWVLCFEPLLLLPLEGMMQLR